MEGVYILDLWGECVFEFTIHTHSSNLADLCDLTVEEARTHAALSITHNRDFLPFHLAVTTHAHARTRTHTHTHTHTHKHTHTHNLLWSPVSSLWPKAFTLSQPQMLSTQQDSNSVPMHVCAHVCVCVWVYLCSLPAYFNKKKRNTARKYKLKDYLKQWGRRKRQ